jgi:hypothetical protein
VVDLAVLEGTDASCTSPKTNSLQSLLDAGYSYNFLNEAMLDLPSATVRKGVLAPDGLQYGALVLSSALRLQPETVDKLISYAKAGLPVILYNRNITRVYGSGTPGTNDALLASRLAAPAKQANVSSATTQSELLALLSKAGITPAADYNVPGLVAVHCASDSGAQVDYYFLYNVSTTALLSTTATLRGIGPRTSSMPGPRKPGPDAAANAAAPHGLGAHRGDVPRHGSRFVELSRRDARRAERVGRISHERCVGHRPLFHDLQPADWLGDGRWTRARTCS